jgi:hypothetical protein
MNQKNVRAVEVFFVCDSVALFVDGDTAIVGGLGDNS